MSDLAALPLPDVAAIQWADAKSKNGVPFAVRTKQDESLAATGVAASGNTVAVNWPVGDGTWKDAGAAKALGIQYYMLTKNSGYFDYICHVIVSEHHKYMFTDEEPDSYSLSCGSNGEHSFKYDSKKPTIKFVQIVD